MKMDTLVKIAFITCKPMIHDDRVLYLSIIYDVNTNAKDCEDYMAQELRCSGYVPVEFWEFPPLPYSTACALARDNEIYSGGQTMVDPEVYFKYGPMSLRTFSQPA